MPSSDQAGRWIQPDSPCDAAHPAADSLTESRRRTRLIFTGGGTGGHLFPGIAVAQAWREAYPESDILFVGSERAVESRILQQAGFPQLGLPFLSPRYAWKHPWRFLRAGRQSRQLAREILRTKPPDLLIGLGGFSSYPLLREASRQQLPLVLLEQNAIPGRVTSLFARRAVCTCGSYSETSRYLPSGANYVQTGNPLRAEIYRLQAARQRATSPADIQARPCLLVCGGSQGSRFINELVTRFVREETEPWQGWHLRLQTGDWLDSPEGRALREHCQQAGISHEIQAFYARPDELYQDVSLMVCRGGGTTLAEAACLNIPCLILPIANSVRNHQFLNAQAHVRAYGGQVLQEQSSHLYEHFRAALRELMQFRQQHPRPIMHDFSGEDKTATLQVVEVIRCAMLGKPCI